MANHHKIDQGFSIPKLDAYFLTVSNQVHTMNISFVSTGKTFVFIIMIPVMWTTRGIGSLILTIPQKV